MFEAAPRRLRAGPVEPHELEQGQLEQGQREEDELEEVEVEHSSWNVRAGTKRDGTGRGEGELEHREREEVELEGRAGTCKLEHGELEYGGKARTGIVSWKRASSYRVS